MTYTKQFLRKFCEGNFPSAKYQGRWGNAYHASEKLDNGKFLCFEFSPSDIFATHCDGISDEIEFILNR